MIRSPSSQPLAVTGCSLANEARANAEGKALRRKATSELGFEEEDAAAGVATIGNLTSKDILFLIDISGSMRGARIENATNNALAVFDKYTLEGDTVGLIWFNSKPKEVFALKKRDKSRGGGNAREKGGTTIRAEIEKTRTAYTGTTAFYDGLIQAMSVAPQSSNSYVVALTDGRDTASHKKLADAVEAIGGAPWTLMLIGLQVDATVRKECEQAADASTGGMYVHANDAGAALDDAFSKVAAQFVMPKVKSADAAAAGGGTRGV